MQPAQVAKNEVARVNKEDTHTHTSEKERNRYRNEELRKKNLSEKSGTSSEK